MKTTTFVACVVLTSLLSPSGILARDGATPIWEPTTITEPGKYVLTREIRALDQTPAIVIEADDVELDLNGFNIFSNEETIRIDGAQRVKVHNGSTNGPDDGSVYILNSSEFVVSDLVIYGQDGAAIGVYNSVNGIIEGNLIRGFSGSGLWIGSTSSHITVRNNRVMGDGIRIEGGFCRVIGNEVSNANIFVIGQGGVVSDNLVSSGGMLVSGSDGYYTGNVVMANSGGFGLVFDELSSGNVYRGNRAKGNGGNTADCNNPSATADFCDEGTDNTSHGDNYMPDQM